MKVPYDEAMDEAETFKIIIGETENLGWFTNFRVDRSTLPDGVFAYDIRGGDEEYFCTVEKNEVIVNHSGTFLTETEILFNEGADRIDLNDDNYSFI